MKGRIRICPLSSGSSGNCVLVKSGDASILIDCGLTGKAAERELKRVGQDPSKLDAIIVTHEHIDHISGVGIMCRRYAIPVFATLGTWLQMIDSIGKIDESLIHYIAAEVPFKIKNCTVTPFATSHDAAESIGLVFSDGVKKGGFVTDLGTVTKHIFDMLCDCSVIMIEANHDEKMLKNGNYPQRLKERILSDCGHLSNRVCGALCARLVREGAVRSIMLGHLSSDNNTPSLAHMCVLQSIERVGYKVGEEIELYVARRDCAGEMLVDEE